MAPTNHLTGREFARLLDGGLKTAGFKRDRTRWNRAHDDDLIDVVDVQTSKSLDEVTINLGIFDPVVYAQVGIGTQGRFVSVPQCVISSRLGPIAGDGDGPWWHLYAASVEPMWAQIRSLGLPWFERLDTRRAIADELDQEKRHRRLIPIEAASYAFLKAGLGDLEAACRELASVRRWVVGDAWPILIDDFARRLGCAHVTSRGADRGT